MFLLLLLVFPIVLVGVALAGVLALLGPLLGFLITLPFRILGLALGLLGGLLLLPLLPLLLIGFGVVWFIRHSNRRALGV